MTNDMIFNIFLALLTGILIGWLLYAEKPPRTATKKDN